MQLQGILLGLQGYYVKKVSSLTNRIAQLRCIHDGVHDFGPNHSDALFCSLDSILRQGLSSQSYQLYSSLIVLLIATIAVN